MSAQRTFELLLLGAGHAHLFVLEALRSRPDLAERTLLVTADPESLYSGMVPGVIGGRYAPGEARLAVEQLASRARVSTVFGRAVGVDPRERRLRLSDGTVLDFQVMSLNIGSTVAGADVPGVAEHAVPTRPMAGLVHRMTDGPRFHHAGPTVVVGGGAAGVELAFALRHRIRKEGGGGDVAILHAGGSIPHGASRAVQRRVGEQARRAGIRILEGRRAEAVEPGGIVVQGGGRVPAARVVWAAGAAGNPFPGRSGLPADDRGFIRVGPALQVEGHPRLFAAGDCAVPSHRPGLPRAGVHAVRQGPVLARNLIAQLDGNPLVRYRPQRDFLTLLNMGDGTAVGGKWGIAAHGRWVMRLKDRIDRAFVRRFS